MNVTEQSADQHRYVFVCGLQRSGTSVLARNIGRFPGTTAFKDTGAIEDEGQYLQDIYPTNNELGGTGWYGFNPKAHLTESSELLTPDNVRRLQMSWSRFWDPKKTIRIEKTPGNLIMTRFLQAVFPNSYFVVIRRHPVSVSIANQRWKKSMAALHVGFDHWLCCYGLFENDKKYLKRVYELTYEDYVSDPARYHREIAAFIGTTSGDAELEQVSESHNKRYFARWTRLLTESSFRSYYRYIARKYEARFGPFGYSLTAVAGEAHSGATGPAPALEWTGPLFCVAADFYAFLWRRMTRVQGKARRLIRRSLPTGIKDGIKRFAQKKAIVPDKAQPA